MNSNMMQFKKRLVGRLQYELITIKDLLPFTPHDFSWKVRRRIRVDRNPLFVVVQDKYRVKEYAQSRGVRVAETLYVTGNPETIPFDSLPKQYFIKANHGCGWNILYTNGEFYLYENGTNFHSSGTGKLTQQQCLEVCHRWLNTIYSRKEWAYSKIPPQLVVEEVLIAPAGEELKEYKFYVFNGSARVVNVRSSSYRLHHQNIFFNTSWEEMILKVYKETVPSMKPPKPFNLNEMIKIAEKLGNDLDFVRVDLFNTKDGIVLGEMTIYPYGGNLNTPTADPEFNKWLGDQWTLPS